jgi:drug/metabolite transporter (DMT)-like permease
MIKLTYLLLCLIWGSTWLAIRLGLDDSPPLWSAGFRYIIASLIMLVVNAFRKAEYPASLSAMIRLALPGVAIYALPYMMVYIAEVHISSALTSVLFASFPFYIAILSLLFFKDEKINWLRWLGLIVGFGGIIVIFYDSLTESQIAFIGAVLVVGGAVFSALGTVWIKKWFPRQDILIMAAVQMIAGAVIINLTAAIFEPITLFKVTAKSIGALLFLAIFGTVIAFNGYFWLLKKIRTISLSMIAFITPVVAINLGYFFRDETFSTFTAVGSALILAGVALVIKK